MKRKVHVVPHMHWDREWYFTTEESRILLINNMKEILERLENDPEYKYYVLDGQSVILEDYLEIKPENKDRIKKLVQTGKLIIGPWYTQTDEIIVNGESIVRNLLYGIKDCEEYGSYMKIGYLPDSFGQTEQMPQILNGFGINRILFWRGVSELHGTDKTEFYWNSQEGSKVLAQIFPLGYAIGKYLPNDEDALKKRLDSYLKVLENGAVTENIILPNGHDQMPIQQDIFEIMEKLNNIYPEKEFFMSNFEKLFEELEKNPEKFDTISGEFLDGKYMRVHKSIYSTRMDIKIIHAQTENKLTNILEPLATIAYSLGFEYYHGLIEKIWKILMKNHAHDSIGCCCSDIVHSQILSRFQLADDMIENLIKFYTRKIVDAIPNKKDMDKLTIFNLLPYKKSDIIKATIRIRSQRFSIYNANNNAIPFTIKRAEEIDPGLVDRQIVHYGVYDPFMEYDIELSNEDIPAMGYTTYYINPNDESSTIVTKTIEKNFIENNLFMINVNSNGSINIFDKKFGKTYKNQMIAEDGSDDGDEYDYSPLLNDWVLTSKNVKATINFDFSAYSENVRIKYRFEVPKDLDSRKNRIIDSYVDFNIKVSLNKNDNKINMEFELDNQAKDHRVRFLFNTGYESNFSITDNQFGTINRPVIESGEKVWIEENWKEKPSPINPMMSFVDLTDSKTGYAILTNGLREYEIIGDKFDTIALTLFRSVGLLGKEELVRRPGRPSGIKLPTPDSQLIGKLKTKFAIFTHEGDTIVGNVPAVAKEFCTELRTYNKIPFDAMKLNKVSFNTPDVFSLLEKEKDGTILSVLKKSEKSEEIILRLFNPSRINVISDSIKFNNKEIASIVYTNLNEEAISNIDKDSVKNLEEFKTCQVKTFKIGLKK